MSKLITGQGGGGGKEARAAVEDPNTLRSKSYAQGIDLLGEGEWEEFQNGVNLNRVYLDEVPIKGSNGEDNFQGYVIETRPGSLSQSRMSIASTTESIEAVGVEVLKATPIEKSISGASIDALRVNVTVPRLTSIDAKTGDVHGYQVDYKIEYNSADNLTYRSPVSTQAYVKTTITGPGPHTGYLSYTVKVSVSLPLGTGTTYYGGGTTIPHVVDYQKRVNSGAWISIFKEALYAKVEKTLNSVSALTTDTVEFRIVATPLPNQPPIATPGSFLVKEVIAEKYDATPTLTIQGKTSSPYERQHSFKVSGTSPFTVRVTRISDDSLTEQIQNKLYFTSVTSVQEEKLRYPGSVLCGWSVDASQFKSIPTRAYKCKMTRVKVPNNYDPLTRTYSGSWAGVGDMKLAWTDNPAWCFYDLLTNTRYGLGERIPASSIDVFALYSIGQYCDGWNPDTGQLELLPNGKGGYEPRFTCNLYIQTREEAYKVIQDMASIFRGMTYWGAGTVVPVQDSPKDPLYVFNNTNVIDGNFQYQSSHVGTRYNAVTVTWNNPADFYRQASVYVEDTASIAKLGYVNVTSTVAFGCTSEAMARRAGKWLLYTNSYDTDVVSFATGAVGSLPRPGDIIRVEDTLRSTERRGGRSKATTSTSVTLDAPFTFGAYTYTISLVDVDGGIQESTITTTGTASVVSVSPAFTKTIAKDSVYVISSSNIPEALFRVISVSEKEGGIFEVSALTHNPSKYDYVEEDKPLTDLTPSKPTVFPVTGLVATEVLYAEGKSYKSKILTTWTAPKFADEYLLTIKAQDGRIWTRTQKNPSYELLEASVGQTYTVSVRTKNTLGQISTPVETSVNIVGKTFNPSDVSGLGYEVIPQAGLRLFWNTSSDIDVVGYEVRDSNAGWKSSGGLIFKGDVTSIVIPPTLGSKTYYVKAIDNVGHYSTNPASIVVVSNAPSAPTGNVVSYADTSTTASTVTFNWVASTSDYLVKGYKAVLTGPASSFVREVFVNTDEWTTFANWLGDATLSVKAVNIWGWESVPAITVASKYPPGVVTDFRAEVIDNNVLLYWTPPVKTTLPVDHIKFRKGATWAGGEDIGTKSGTFTVIFETKPGTFTYWAAAVDTDDNEGEPVSLTTKVDEPPDYVLQADYFSTFTGTKSNAYLQNEELLLPVNATETWQQHFVNNAWNTPQDQVNAGYPLYIQPTPSSGYYEEVIDFTATFPGVKITVTPVGSVVNGSATVTCDISTSINGSTWTNYPNTQVVYGINFRYVKVRLTVNTPANGLNIYKFTSLNVKLESKAKEDFGTVNCVSTDANGTIFNFNKTFLDVSSLILTPQGTTASYVVYDYQDSYINGTYSVTSNVCTVNATGHSLIAGQAVLLNFETGTAPSGTYLVASVTNANTYTVSLVTANTSGTISTYPQGARAFRYNSAGTRVSGNASWTVKGY